MCVRHSRLNRLSCVFSIFFHVTCWRASQKKSIREVFDFLKKLLGSISPKITQKTENDTVGRYRFRYNLDSKFDVKKQIFWAMGKTGRGFGLEFVRKSNVKKILIKKKENCWIWWFLIFCILIVGCCSSREQPKYKVLLFIKNFSSAHFTRNNLWSKQSEGMRNKWAVRK